MAGEDQNQPSVPFWALTLVADVASIKALAGRLPVIERELEAVRTQQVPLSEHKLLMVRTDTMWDSFQRELGARSRDRLWMTGLSVAVAALGLIQGLHLFGVVH